MDTHVCILFDISLSSLPIVLPHIVIKLKMWEGNCKRSQSQKKLYICWSWVCGIFGLCPSISSRTCCL